MDKMAVVRVVQALKHVREFGEEMQGLRLNEAEPLVQAQYARHRLIEELAMLEKVLDWTEYEERRETEGGASIGGRKEPAGCWRSGEGEGGGG